MNKKSKLKTFKNLKKNQNIYIIKKHEIKIMIIIIIIIRL